MLWAAETWTFQGSFNGSFKGVRRKLTWTPPDLPPPAPGRNRTAPPAGREDRLGQRYRAASDHAGWAEIALGKATLPPATTSEVTR